MPGISAARLGATRARSSRASEGPQQVGVALDALARVVDEPVPEDQVLRVAQRDEGVVADPGELDRARDADREQGGEPPEDRGLAPGHGAARARGVATSQVASATKASTATLVAAKASSGSGRSAAIPPSSAASAQSATPTASRRSQRSPHAARKAL